MAADTGKGPTDPHLNTISPMGYVKIPPKVAAAVGLGPGVRVVIQADPASGTITIRTAPEAGKKAALGGAPSTSGTLIGGSQAKPAPRRPLAHCAAGMDGECYHEDCPQERDGEPARTGRHCPLDTHGDEEL